MQDLIMASNNPQFAKLQSPLQPASNELILQTQVKILQALQTSFDPQEQLQLFFKHIQSLVALSGMQLLVGEKEYKAGRKATHLCSYRLMVENAFLGELQCSKSRRFSEDELIQLEMFIGSFAFALRNSIRYQEALTLALIDPLTLLGNRAALEASIKRELPLAERHQQDLSLLMIDVDYFKSINDTYGHDKGDKVLREIAKTVQTVCRETDMVFRYGGEEFLVILRNTNPLGARIIAERIRQQIATTGINLHGTGSIQPTVSIGISSLAQGKKEKSQSLFKRADVALYKAKSAGRNCVMA